ncbi:MAG: hypothetical protein ACYTG6_04455, partial [Planctomycetota bacterium]
MRWTWRQGAEPLPPGPKGRILFLGAFNGGVGGVERLTRSFAHWVEDSGYTATMLFRHADLGGGPNVVTATERVRVLPDRAWGRRLADASYDFVYVLPPGLGARRWVPRLRGVQGTRVVLDLDPKRKYLDVTDVLHCEAPRDEVLPRPHVVAVPDPRPSMVDVGEQPPGDFHLTVFNPYGTLKGQRHVPAFLEATQRRLVWCYDPASWAGRKHRYGRQMRESAGAVRHPRLDLIESPTQAALYRLYGACAGYVCFSDREGLGWSLLDALVLGKP